MSSALRFPDAVPELIEETVYLRELTEADIPAWFERATDAEAADLAGDPVPESIDAGTRWLQLHRDRFNQQAAIRWAIVETDGTESIGTVGLTITSKDDRVADLGIVIGRAHWGKGLGTAAAQLATSYGFDTLGLAEIHAEVLQRNSASVRLLEKTGFRLLRTIERDPQSTSSSEDCFLYVLESRGTDR